MSAKKPMRLRPTLPKKVRKALNDIIEYAWDDELESAEESLRDEGNIKGHIFCALVEADNWLRGTDVTPEDYLDEEEEDEEED